MKTLKALCDLSDRRVMKTGLLVVVYLAFIGCAQFKHQVPQQLPFMDRSQTKSDGRVRVTVAVPSAEESRQIFGYPLADKNIQPVWLEVENNSDTGFFLYYIAMDPDIYSSGEVAWKFQSSLYSKNSQRDIYNLFRDNEIEWYFKPGTTTAGFVYTNLKMGTKKVLVRLYADKNVKEIVFFIEVPGLKADHHQLDPYTLYSEDEARNYLIQDLLESQKVAKLGFVDGVGEAGPDNPRYNLTDSPYWTDGLWAVFVFSADSTALDDLEFFDWRGLEEKYE